MTTPELLSVALVAFAAFMLGREERKRRFYGAFVNAMAYIHTRTQVAGRVTILDWHRAVNRELVEPLIGGDLLSEEPELNVQAISLSPPVEVAKMIALTHRLATRMTEEDADYKFDPVTGQVAREWHEAVRAWEDWADSDD